MIWVILCFLFYFHSIYIFLIIFPLSFFLKYFHYIPIFIYHFKFICYILISLRFLKYLFNSLILVPLISIHQFVSCNTSISNKSHSTHSSSTNTLDVYLYPLLVPSISMQRRVTSNPSIFSIGGVTPNSPVSPACLSWSSTPPLLSPAPHVDHLGERDVWSPLHHPLPLRKSPFEFRANSSSDRSNNTRYGDPLTNVSPAAYCWVGILSCLDFFYIIFFLSLPSYSLILAHFARLIFMALFIDVR